MKTPEEKVVEIRARSQEIELGRPLTGWERKEVEREVYGEFEDDGEFYSEDGDYPAL